jgi:putative DNA primase/helicase
VFDDGGTRWGCFRCGWTGGLAGRDWHQARARRPRTSDPPQTRTEFRPSPEAFLELWTACKPISTGTVAASYLERRGCALPHPDGDLRWHHDLRHPSSWRGPALVALVTDARTGEAMTLHKTWVARDGSGKAPIDKPRLLLKGWPKAGGCARLWPDEDISLGLCIAEGIETALAAARGFGLAWSTIDAGNLARFPVLAGLGALTIAADNDATGLGAAEACARAWGAAGVEVYIWRAPGQYDDLADWALAP